MQTFLLRLPHAALPPAPARLPLKVRLARGFIARARGLLGTRSLAPDRGLLIPHCNAVHTCGMRYSIDVVFLDCAGKVIEVRVAVPPWRICRLQAADAVLELGAGTAAAAGITPGQSLADILPADWAASRNG